MASEMKEPVKPITADITSSACRLRSTPFFASTPSRPSIWNTTLTTTRTAALVARNSIILIMFAHLAEYPDRTGIGPQSGRIIPWFLHH